MNEFDVMKKAREKLTDENKWAQGGYAFNSDNEIVDDNSDQACSWCLVGAIYSISGHETPLSNRVVWTLDSYVGDGYCSTIDYNDSLDIKHTDVMRFLDMVIDDNYFE